jgi:hypothetical protein
VLALGHGEHAIECLTHADMVDHDTSKASGMARARPSSAAEVI